MRTRTTATVAGLLLAVGLALTACSNSSHTDAKPSTIPATAPITARATSTAVVKLSTTWVPKFRTLTDGPGASACTSDSSNHDCAQAITTSLTLLNQLIETIVFGNHGSEYLQTTTAINETADDAESYVREKCGSHPFAGAPCQKYATVVVVGIAGLPDAMQADEQIAGAV